MKELIDKLSSYNIFNYLIPGILFAAIAKEFTLYNLIQENLIIGVFVYYFIGLVISRFGSLIIGPLLKKISFIKFSDYSDFISASKKDPKIDLFSEVNNMYRTLSSMFMLIFLLMLYGPVESIFPVFRRYKSYVLVISLLIMFLFSYRKQTNFINNRIKENK